MRDINNWISPFDSGNWLLFSFGLFCIMFDYYLTSPCTSFDGIFYFSASVIFNMVNKQKSEPKNEVRSIEEDVLTAKIKFLKAANSFTPFNFVVRYPKTSLGCAFCLGFGVEKLFKGVDKISIVPLTIQLTRLFLKILTP